MKKFWYSNYESIKGPLTMYLIAMILLAIPNIFSSTNQVIATTLVAFKYAGGLIKTLLPVFVIINIIGKNHEDSVPVLGGVISYVLLHLVTMFVASQSFDAQYYTSLGSGLLEGIAGLNRKPLNMGYIASVVVIVIVFLTYRVSRQRFNYGMLTFIDNDSWFLIICSVITIITGVAISFVFPYGVSFLNKIMTFVSQNSTNPGAMFVYGLIERTMELLDMDDILHNSFWIGNYGGNWLDSAGNLYIGDVNIWTAQMSKGMVELGVGKYITPYYIINMFIVPALIVGIYCQYSSKIERRRLLGLMVIAVAVSVTSSSLVPVQLLLLFMSPTLLIIHMLLSSSVYMVFSMLEIYLGYFYSDALAFAIPGTIVEFIKMSGMLSQTSLRNILLIGGGYFVLYFAVVWIYYHVLALDFLEGEAKVRNRKEMIRALGGLNNLRVVDGSPTSMSVAVKDTTKIKIQPIMDLGAYKVTESFFYHRIFFGPGSVCMARQIRKELKQFESIQKYIEMK